MRIVVALLILVHGLITTAQATGASGGRPGVPNPPWMGWWPTPMGQSWLLTRFGLENSILGSLAGILWLIAGACLIAAALGVFGFLVPAAWWRALAAAGALLSLVLFALYAHPFFAIGIAANLAILIVLLWAKWPSVQVLGS